MTKIDLKQINPSILLGIKKVHFIGIGGIGVSAIARMMLLDIKTVSGSDQSISALTEELSKAGAEIFQGHNASQVPTDADLVIYTIAIPLTNPELIKAEELKIPTLSYPEVLGLLSQDKFTVAVSGTHGKTTTTAMIAEMALSADLNPTVIVGSILKDQKSNFIAGNNDCLIVEACEYRRSFLNLWPKILIITNIETDHLDYYKDLEDIQNAFAELANRVPVDGFIVCDPSDENVKPVISGVKGKIIDYPKVEVEGLALQTPGAHNLKNAQVALAVAEALGLPSGHAREALERFTGTWRRFEYKGETSAGALIYDDYAHHPTEIKATLRAAKEVAKGKKIIVAFQPHLYSRTESLFDDFATALALADRVFVLPIYAAREKDSGRVSSEQLAEAVNRAGGKADYVSDFTVAAEKLKTEAETGDIIVIMGAGDVFKIADELIQ